MLKGGRLPVSPASLPLTEQVPMHLQIYDAKSILLSIKNTKNMIRQTICHSYGRIITLFDYFCQLSGLEACVQAVEIGRGRVYHKC